MSSEQAKPTRGGYIKSGYFTSNLHTQEPNGYTILDPYGNPVADVPRSYVGNGVNTKKHAELVTEAFNVLHETGMTPRQLQQQRDELLAALVKALPAIEEIRLVDLGALRDAENLGIASKIQRARRELAERVEIINTIITAIASAKGGAA